LAYIQYSQNKEKLKQNIVKSTKVKILQTLK